MRFAIYCLVVFCLAGAAWGQTCTAPMMWASYGVVCTGSISPAQGAPQVAFSAIGTVTGDNSGTFTGVAKASIGGNIVTQTVTGTAKLNGDCTGTITYKQTIEGQKAPDLNIVFHLLDQGKEIRGMSIDPGATMICNLKLISR